MSQVRAATVLALIARALLSSAVARLLGINHVALEVDDVDAALNWYGRFFGFELRGRAGARMAFVDLGDQFVALSAGRSQEADEGRHVGFVVDDKEAVRAALLEGGVSVRRRGRLDFLDPWGNHVEVVDYRDIQFTKAPEVLDAMDVGELSKSEAAREELRRKGISSP